MLVALSSSSCAEIEWKSLNYLSSFNKCWACLTTKDGKSTSAPISNCASSVATMERVLRREPTFRHILLLLTTTRNKFHLDMDGFYQNCCAPCTEIFQNLVLLEEQLEQVEAKISTYFEMLRDKRKNKSGSSSSSFSNSGIDVKDVEQTTTEKNHDDNKLSRDDDDGMQRVVLEEVVIKVEETSDQDEFVLGLIKHEVEEGKDDVEMELEFKSEPEIEQDPLDFDFYPENSPSEDEDYDDNKDVDINTVTSPKVPSPSSPIIIKNSRPTNRKKSFHCSACGKVLSSKVALVGHELLVCKVPLDLDALPCKITLYPCTEEECGAKFYTKKDLARHTVTHTGAQPFSCDKCHATFSRQDSLKLHVDKFCRFGPQLDRKKQVVVKDIDCELCGKTFSAKNLPDHMNRVHLKVHRFSCHYCGAKFYHKNDLRKHFKRRHETKGEDGMEFDEFLKASKLTEKTKGVST